MGERGPKPTPPNLHILRGNPSKKKLAALLDDAVRPQVDIPECPAHLEGEARAEWDRITPHLYKLGLISQIDRAALSAYCDTWGEYVLASECVRSLQEHMRKCPDAKMKDMPEGVQDWFAGRVSQTPSGYQQISIPVQHRNKSLEQLRSFLAMFGLSPADRTRVTPSDARGTEVPEPEQGELPGVEPKPEAGGWATFK